MLYVVVSLLPHVLALHVEVCDPDDGCFEVAQSAGRVCNGSHQASSPTPIPAASSAPVHSSTSRSISLFFKTSRVYNMSFFPEGVVCSEESEVDQQEQHGEQMQRLCVLTFDADALLCEQRGTFDQTL